MKSPQSILATLLFLVGLLVAAWSASPVPKPEAEDAAALDVAIERVTLWGSGYGLPFLVGLAMMIAGGVLARRVARLAHQARPAEGEREGDSASKEAALPAVVSELQRTLRSLFDKTRDAEALPAQRSALLGELDSVLEEFVPAFIEHQPRMIHTLGMTHFAEMIGSFAAMERAAARAWSALTDEAWAEVPACVARAKEAFEEAQSQLRAGRLIDDGSDYRGLA